MDFLHDRLATKRPFRVLTMVDEYSRESPAIVADTSLTGARVVEVLGAPGREPKPARAHHGR